MAYFDCQIVQGGGGLILVVTCHSFFAGATITATDGETTLQATCPSSSPYTVEFKIPNSGSWTISGTASGQTGSTTVVIPDSATLTPPIPTGSTVTPVNDIQIWLHCANIWNKNYTTITQVLADASTLQALIASNNAADYMARSTSWASSVTANSTAMTYIGANNYCANKLLANSTWLNAICNSTYFESVLNVKVPTMTSNTTPSGVASATKASASGDGSAFQAFDKNTSTYWTTANGGGGMGTIYYQFTQNVKVYMFTYKGYAANNTANSVSVVNSSDVSIFDTTLENNNNVQKKPFIASYSGSKYGLKINSMYGVTVASAVEINFYGRAV